MTIWWLILILSFILAGGLGFIWLVIRLGKPDAVHRKATDSYQKMAAHDVEHIFNDEFREELRNRGRLHFEQILGENAKFFQQDLRLTTAQLNDYMKDEISRQLKEAFANYEQAISDAKQLAVESIQKTKTVIDEQRQALGTQLEKEVSDEKGRRIDRFDKHMAEVVNHWIVAAIGDQIDLADQLEYILGELETNKAAIIEDITNGA